MKRALPVVEVAVVLALFAGLRLLLRDTPFAAWQAEYLGGAPASGALLFFVLPTVFFAQ